MEDGDTCDGADRVEEDGRRREQTLAEPRTEGAEEVGETVESSKGVRGNVHTNGVHAHRLEDLPPLPAPDLGKKLLDGRMAAAVDLLTPPPSQTSIAFRTSRCSHV